MPLTTQQYVDCPQGNIPRCAPQMDNQRWGKGASVPRGVVRMPRGKCKAHHMLDMAGVNAAAGAVRADQHHGRVIRRRCQEHLRMHGETGMSCRRPRQPQLPCYPSLHMPALRQGPIPHPPSSTLRASQPMACC